MEKKYKIKYERSVSPDVIFRSKVVASGNGAVIRAYKKYIGCHCTILIESKYSDIEEDNTGWE